MTGVVVERRGSTRAPLWRWVAGMTEDKDFKRVVRERARKTGESYAAARRSLAAAPAGGAGKAPAHWGMTGSHAPQYSHDLDPEERYEGKRVARLTFTAAGEPGGFGATYQQFSAKPHIGSRMRLSAALRTDGVTGWAGLWFRIDNAAGRTLEFDNMEARALSGSTPWTRAEVVLDVPDEANVGLIGVIASGRGSVSIADMRLETVDDSVPVTGSFTNLASLPDVPLNLDFDEEAPTQQA
jgi:hypothetical protein